MKLSDLVKTYLQNYNFLIDQIAYLFTDDDDKLYISELNKESKDKKWLRGVDFNKLLTDDLFILFIESKTKLFSHSDDLTKSISECLFGEKLCLKKIFHNRDDSIRFVLWYYLQVMNLMIELGKKDKNEDRIKQLGDLIDSNIAEYEKNKETAKKLNETGMSDPKNFIKDTLGVEVNNQTNNMLDDIVKSFEGTISGMKNGQAPDIASLFPSILEISKTISTKYGDKISNGEIELGKIMGGITKNIPGFSGGGGGKDGMPDLGKMMEGMMNGGGSGGFPGGGGGLPPELSKMMEGLGGLGGLGNMFKKPEKKEIIMIDENFSTANVDLGKVNDSKGINIGKMLNVANSLGVIPDLPGQKTEETNDDGMPGMPKLTDLFGMLGGGSNKNPEELKNQLEGMMGKMGIDLSKLGLDDLTGKPKENELD